MCCVGRFYSLQILLQFVVVLVIFRSHVEADMKWKLSCFGENLKLECPMMNVLVIHFTSLSIPLENSSLCKKESTHAVPCDLMAYSNSLRAVCSGKRSCALNQKSEGAATKKCNARFVLTVLYECKSMRINATSRTITTSSKVILMRTFGIHSLVPTKTRTKFNGSNETETVKKVGPATCLFYTLFSATVALQYMQGRPKHVILCVVLSVSAGIVLLIATVLVMACIERIIEEKENEKKDNAPVEISLPLLVTPGSNLPPATQIDSAPASDSGSGQREATLTRVQSIRRSHSVDEGTQTDLEMDEACSLDNGPSDTEAKELGYLVDIMRYYNSNLENLNSTNEPLSLKREAQIGTPESSKQRSELAYSGPRIVDTSRRRQPRLSCTTYSSSNNSENGDVSMYMHTPSIRHNHINTALPSVSTLPRRRPNLVPKHDTLGHTTNSLHSYHSPTMQNGPRRMIGRTRFADEAPNMAPTKPYANLS